MAWLCIILGSFLFFWFVHNLGLFDIFGLFGFVVSHTSVIRAYPSLYAQGLFLEKLSGLYVCQDQAQRSCARQVFYPLYYLSIPVLRGFLLIFLEVSHLKVLRALSSGVIPSVLREPWVWVPGQSNPGSCASTLPTVLSFCTLMLNFDFLAEFLEEQTDVSQCTSPMGIKITVAHVIQSP